jgi:hypothetical protein
MTSVINAPSVKKALQVTNTRPSSSMKPPRAEVKVGKALPWMQIVAIKSLRKRRYALFYLGRKRGKLGNTQSWLSHSLLPDTSPVIPSGKPSHHIVLGFFMPCNPLKSAPIENPPISSKALPITGFLMTVQSKGPNGLP